MNVDMSIKNIWIYGYKLAFFTERSRSCVAAVSMEHTAR